MQLWEESAEVKTSLLIQQAEQVPGRNPNQGSPSVRVTFAAFELHPISMGRVTVFHEQGYIAHFSQMAQHATQGKN